MNLVQSIFYNISNSLSRLSQKQFVVLIIILGLPAYLLNLGMLPIIGDEGIRNLVALEMKLSGNFIVPTLNGELYLNKPPLFNWLIYLSSEALGFYGEWPSRLLNLMFLFLFAITVYYWSSKYQSFVNPLLLTLMLLTSGRILFWDSMFGLIDICFSWIVFLNFMLLFHFGNQRKWISCFLISYLLCCIAFMLKGLPALVFQAISITATLIFFESFKKEMFSWKHIGSALIGMLPVIAYYGVYMNFVPLDQVFSVLMDQSMQRTATHHGIFKMILHFFSFPFEQIYHFLPWSLFIVFFFSRNFWQWIQSNPFVKFNLVILLSNLPVYWLSVEVYPRYLLMFIPLFNLIVVFLYNKWSLWNPKFTHLFYKLFFTLTAILTMVSIGLPFFPGSEKVANLIVIWIFSTLILTCLLIPIWKFRQQWMIWFALFVFGIRIVFNLTVLPVRAIAEKSYTCKMDARRIHEQYHQMNWYVFDSTEMHQISRFYMTNFHQRIITKKKVANDTMGLYLVDSEKYPDFSGVKQDSLYVETGKLLHLMKWKHSND